MGYHCESCKQLHSSLSKATACCCEQKPKRPVGRPPVEHPKQTYNTRLPQEIIDWLRSRKNAALTLAEIIKKEMEAADGG